MASWFQIQGLQEHADRAVYRRISAPLMIDFGDRVHHGCMVLPTKVARSSYLH
jgi:hypothetical protein